MPPSRVAVVIEVLGRMYSATIVMTSENRASLMLAIDDSAVRVPGGVMVGYMALLGDPSTGEYVDIVTNTSVKVIEANSA